MDKIRQLQDMINESNRIVFFGGAGVSTESNIPDFRSADGLYKQKYRYSPEQIVSHSFFMQHTEEFYDFYKEKMMFLDAKPNKAHLKLAELEAAGKLTPPLSHRISTDSTRLPEAKMYWSFMEVSTAITACVAKSSTVHVL